MTPEVSGSLTSIVPMVCSCVWIIGIGAFYSISDISFANTWVAADFVSSYHLEKFIIFLNKKSYLSTVRYYLEWNLGSDFL